jgi:hypothetical protein
MENHLRYLVILSSLLSPAWNFGGGGNCMVCLVMVEEKEVDRAGATTTANFSLQLQEPSPCTVSTSYRKNKV